MSERAFGIKVRAGTFLIAIGLAILPLVLMAGQTAAETASWSVLVDSSHPGYAAGESYSLRGVALSPDGSVVYGSWLHTGTGIVVDAYDATTGTLWHSSAPIPGTDGVDYVQSKAIAVDSRGYVFTGSGDPGYGDNDYPFIQAYSADLQTTFGSATTLGDPNIEYKRFGGLATWRNGSNYYLYATRESGSDGFYVQRFNVNDVNDISLDTSFGNDGTFNLQSLPEYSGVGHPHGIAVAADGTIYVASFDEGASDSDLNAAVGTVYKIAPDGSSAVSVTVPGAFDVALAGSILYVSEYGEGNYPAVTLLNASTLANEGSLYTGYTNTNTSRDSGYSGIAVSPQGQIYLADQFYSNTSYSDRLLVSSSFNLVSAPPVVTHHGFWAVVEVEVLNSNGEDVSNRHLTVTAENLAPSGDTWDGENGNFVYPFQFGPAFGSHGHGRPDSGYRLMINTRNLSPGDYTLSYTVSGDPTIHTATITVLP